MREITKTLTIPVDGKKMDFRLTKLDAFSGASLLRIRAVDEPSTTDPGENNLTEFKVLFGDTYA
jgi:hypothetical protein